MSKIAHSVEELIGHTPLLTLERYGARHGFSAQVLAKLEYLNPAGSVKDRVAKAMLDDGEAKGLLTPGTVITIPANVKHWHGAKKDSWFSHIAVEVPGEETSNEWLEAVDDEAYAGLE